MRPKRGVATVKKQNKHIVINGSDEDIGSPPPREDEGESPGSSHVNRDSDSDDKSDNRLQVARKEQKRSNLPPTPQQGSRLRQETVTDEQEQSISRGGLDTLFDDLEDEETSDTAVDDDLNNQRARQPERSEQQHQSIREPKRVVRRSPNKVSHARNRENSQFTQLNHVEVVTPDPSAFHGLPDDAYKARRIMSFIQPSQWRHMRACMVCSIVRTYQQFHTGGCPNCEQFMELAGNGDAIQECTSQVFDGLMTIADTNKSWVARYQRLEGYVPGVYAVQVEGILPEDIVIAAENAGVQYIPRDGSASETLPVDG